MDDVRRIYEATTNGYFFSEATLRFFRSRISDTLYAGRWFVTSECDSNGTNRRYTVRDAHWVSGELRIDTVGEFKQYDTSHAAHKAAKALADGLGTNDGPNDDIE